MTNKKNNNLDAATLGKIVLARFLTLPLRTYDRCVAKTESSIKFAEFTQWVKPSILKDARLDDSEAGVRTVSPQTLGEIRLSGGRPIFVYHKPSFIREYLFDEAGLKLQRDAHIFPSELTATLHRLRLINSRNRLTNALMQALLDTQASYLISGDPLALVPLPQARMSGILAERNNLPMVADAGRLSRLIRVLSLRMINGGTLPLIALFPSKRQLHCYQIDSLIKREKTLILEKKIAHPLPDEAIAVHLKQQYGTSLSRRTVAAVRHRLDIPDWRRRSERKDYLVATEGFSPLLPLTPQALSTFVPPHSGVYEIRSATNPDDWNLSDIPLSPDRTRIVYIGSTRDLRKRLADHLRCKSGNTSLSSCLSAGGAKVRFRVVGEDWRLEERRLYHSFCETFGAPPPCNRMSP